LSIQERVYQGVRRLSPGPFSSEDISKISKVAVGQAQRTLSKLKREGLLDSTPTFSIFCKAGANLIRTLTLEECIDRSEPVYDRDGYLDYTLFSESFYTSYKETITFNQFKGACSRSLRPDVKLYKGVRIIPSLEHETQSKQDPRVGLGKRLKRDIEYYGVRFFSSEDKVIEVFIKDTKKPLFCTAVRTLA